MSIYIYAYAHVGDKDRISDSESDIRRLICKKRVVHYFDIRIMYMQCANVLTPAYYILEISEDSSDASFFGRSYRVR